MIHTVVNYSRFLNFSPKFQPMAFFWPSIYYSGGFQSTGRILRTLKSFFKSLFHWLNLPIWHAILSSFSWWWLRIQNAKLFNKISWLQYLGAFYHDCIWRIMILEFENLRKTSKFTHQSNAWELKSSMLWKSLECATKKRALLKWNSAWLLVFAHLTTQCCASFQWHIQVWTNWKLTPIEVIINFENFHSNLEYSREFWKFSSWIKWKSYLQITFMTVYFVRIDVTAKCSQNHIVFSFLN